MIPLSGSNLLGDLKGKVSDSAIFKEEWPWSGVRVYGSVKGTV